MGLQSQNFNIEVGAQNVPGLLVVDNITWDLIQAVSFFLYHFLKSFNDEAFASGNAFQLMVHDIAYVFVTYMTF